MIGKPTESASRPGRWLWWLVLLILVGVAGVVLPLVRLQRDPVADRVPAVGLPTWQQRDPPPSPRGGEDAGILLRQPFDGPGAWQLSPEGQARLADGRLLLDDLPADDLAWARPGLRLQDFWLEVDARWLGGQAGGKYGLLFRYQDAGNHYRFILGNDGWYNVAKVRGGRQETVVEAFSPAIQGEGGSNHFHLEVQGNTFRFFVNDAYLADVVDPPEASLDAGDVMLVAQKADGTDRFAAAFDNLVLGVFPRP